MEPTSVQVGEKVYRVRRFNPFKVVWAGKIVSQVTEQVKEIIDADDAFVREYGEQHKRVISRELADQRIGLLEKQLDEVEDDEAKTALGQALERWREMRHGELAVAESVAFPREPEWADRVLSGFPKAFALIPNETKRLVALVVADPSELYDAEKRDEFTKFLDDLGDELLLNGEIEEVVELVAAAGEMVLDQLARVTGPFRKLQALYRRALPGSREQTSERSPTPPTEPQFDHKVKAGGGEIRPVEDETPTPSSPESSTSSPAPTTGAETTSSTASAGTRLND